MADLHVGKINQIAELAGLSIISLGDISQIYSNLKFWENEICLGREAQLQSAYTLPFHLLQHTFFCGFQNCSFSSARLFCVLFLTLAG